MRLPSGWLIIGALAVLTDYAVGRDIRLTFAFVIPVLLAAWHRGMPAAWPFVVALPMGRLWLNFESGFPDGTDVATVNFLVRITVLWTVAMLAARTGANYRALQREVGSLKNLLPTCANCRQPQPPERMWRTLDSSVATDARKSTMHILCDDCTRKLYPELFNKSSPRPQVN